MHLDRDRDGVGCE
ncbi:excalibur calcium-binding domain-containing protein [Arthrobacter sp. D1-17]